MSQRPPSGRIGDTAGQEVMLARNVILFGESGVGKSSIINMIAGKEVAKSDNDVRGCTLECTPYTFTLDSRLNVVKLWDTVGLDEGTAGATPAVNARRKLKQFLQEQLSTSEGIDLLIYCIRAEKIKSAHLERYRFVYEEVCRKAVPVAIVATGLEKHQPEGDMDSWWSDNEGVFLTHGSQFCAHACITALPRSQHGDVSRFDLSQRRLRDLLEGDFHVPRNVLIFGEYPIDRTALIDMIAGNNAPPKVGHGSGEVLPFEWNHVAIPQDDLNLWSVAGLDDSDNIVSAPLVEKNLKLFLEEINLTAGIDLLVFCMRAGRAKFTHVRNYNVFCAAICRKKVPVVLVVLGSSADEDKWWGDNERGLREKGMRFEKHVHVPCSTSSGQPLSGNDATRLRLINLMREKYVSGTWRVGGDVFGMVAPDVRTLTGESWRREIRPTPTIAICDMASQETLLEIAPGVRASLQSASVLINELEYRFQRVYPHSLTTTGSPGTRPHVSEHGRNGIRLLMFFMPATATEATWITLSQFYSAYRGDVIPLIIILQGPTGQRSVENVWKDAPLNIRRRISAYLTYHPPLEADSQVQATTTTLTDMIEERCLVAFGARTLVLQGILSYWRRYRSGRLKDSTGRN